MKVMALLILCLFIGTFAQAQIANTKWTGTLAVPELSQVTLKFQADVFEVYLSENNELIESMTYKITGDTIMLKKNIWRQPMSGRFPIQVKIFH